MLIKMAAGDNADCQVEDEEEKVGTPPRKKNRKGFVGNE